MKSVVIDPKLPAAAIRTAPLTQADEERLKRKTAAVSRKGIEANLKQ